MNKFRYTLLLAPLLTGCDSATIKEAPAVYFAEPFPADAPDLATFPAAQQGTYHLAGDTTQQLLIGQSVVWRRKVEVRTVSRADYESDSILSKLEPGNRVLVEGFTYRPLQIKADTVRLELSRADTLFSLHWPGKSRLRYWLGSYYLNMPEAAGWRVRRLLLDGPRVRWQAPSPDQLRLAQLPASLVHQTRLKGGDQWELRPASLPQARQVALAPDLWVGTDVHER